MIDRITSLLLIQKVERRNVMYFLFLFLLLGCGMAIGRASAGALFFKRYGIEHLPLVYMIQGGLLFLVTLIYGSYADRVAPEKLLKPLVYIICAGLVGLWYSMSFHSWEAVYPVYLLFYEMLSEIFF